MTLYLKYFVWGLLLVQCNVPCQAMDKITSESKRVAAIPLPLANGEFLPLYNASGRYGFDNHIWYMFRGVYREYTSKAHAMLSQELMAYGVIASLSALIMSYHDTMSIVLNNNYFLERITEIKSYFYDETTPRTRLHDFFVIGMHPKDRSEFLTGWLTATLHDHATQKMIDTYPMCTIDSMTMPDPWTDAHRRSIITCLRKKFWLSCDDAARIYVCTIEPYYNLHLSHSAKKAIYNFEKETKINFELLQLMRFFAHSYPVVTFLNTERECRKYVACKRSSAVMLLDISEQEFGEQCLTLIDTLKKLPSRTRRTYAAFLSGIFVHLDRLKQSFMDAREVYKGVQAYIIFRKDSMSHLEALCRLP